MPARYAEESAKLCQHANHTDIRQTIANEIQAKFGRLGAIEACEGPRDQLAHATNEEERDDAQESLDEAMALIPEWDDLIEEIESELAASRVAVKAICDGKSSFEYTKSMH